MAKHIVVLLVIVLSSPVNAADDNKELVLGRVISGLVGPASSNGVSTRTVSEIDLGYEFPNLKAEQLRYRTQILTLEPGGVVLIHSHKDRPATTYILSGQAIEYRSDVEGPILHKTGEATIDTNGTSQWWENNSSEAVIMFIGEVVKIDNLLE